MIRVGITTIVGDEFVFKIYNSSTVDEFRKTIEDDIDSRIILSYNGEELITGKYMKGFRGHCRLYELVGEEDITLEGVYP